MPPLSLRLATGPPCGAVDFYHLFGGFSDRERGDKSSYAEQGSPAAA